MKTNRFKLIFALLVGVLLSGSYGCSAQTPRFEKSRYNLKKQHRAAENQQLHLEQIFAKDNFASESVPVMRQMMGYAFVPSQENGGGAYFVENTNKLSEYYALHYSTLFANTSDNKSKNPKDTPTYEEFLRYIKDFDPVLYTRWEDWACRNLPRDYRQQNK